MGKVTCMEEAICEVNNIVLQCPKLEPFACKKLEKLLKELAFKLKVCQEWEELKVKELELKEKVDLKKEAAALKFHKELEEIKCKKEACEVHMHEEVEELKCKVDLIGHEINPVEKIKCGFLKFKSHFEQEKEYYEKIAECHKPKFLIFSCCDSRVDPFKILNLDLGEAIVVRSVACLVAGYGEEGACPSNHAAIEYAVKEVKVEHILVIGHSHCDGIQALVKTHHEAKTHYSESYKNWLKIGEHSCKKVKETHSSASFEEHCHLCEKECVNHSLHNCLTYPFVKEAVACKKMSLHGGYYDLHKCTFSRWSLDYNYSEGEKYC
ncbi:hypothetical protein L7F22_034665 [Adiantum nelumboides]|nr:hypothetical protein [Adiantum nelumboides]